MARTIVSGDLLTLVFILNGLILKWFLTSLHAVAWNMYSMVIFLIDIFALFRISSRIFCMVPSAFSEVFSSLFRWDLLWYRASCNGRKSTILVLGWVTNLYRLPKLSFCFSKNNLYLDYRDRRRYGLKGPLSSSSMGVVHFSLYLGSSTSLSSSGHPAFSWTGRLSENWWQSQGGHSIHWWHRQQNCSAWC